MSPSAPQDDTYFAWLTPAGSAAIATLAVRGPRAWTVLQELFQPTSGRPLAEPDAAESGLFRLGWLGAKGAGERDEVVLASKRSGPAPWFELHCHGGRQVRQFLEELLAARGIHACSWQELGRLTGEEPGRAMALAALAEAATTRTAAILLDQYHGAFGRAVTAVCDSLQRQDLAEASRLLEELGRMVPLGRRLTTPWRVAILGAPNVGKSSLINLLSGYQRSVVDPTPGTTRDLVTSRVALDGWPVELVDTAGWRTAATALEQEGIALARAAAVQADLRLWVLDASAPPVWPAADFPAVHFVLNKTDLPAAWDVSQIPAATHVSARSGAGLAELCQAIAHWLVPDPPASGIAVPFTPLLCDRVEEARRRCAAGQGSQALETLQHLY